MTEICKHISIETFGPANCFLVCSECKAYYQVIVETNEDDYTLETLSDNAIDAGIMGLQREKDARRTAKREQELLDEKLHSILQKLMDALFK